LFENSFCNDHQVYVRLGVKLRYSIRAVVGSASEWYRTWRGAI